MCIGRGINNISKVAIVAYNFAREMGIFSHLAFVDGDHNGVSFVEMIKLFIMQHSLYYELNHMTDLSTIYLEVPVKFHYLVSLLCCKMFT